MIFQLRCVGLSLQTTLEVACCLTLRLPKLSSPPLPTRFFAPASLSLLHLLHPYPRELAFSRHFLSSFRLSLTCSTSLAVRLELSFTVMLAVFNLFIFPVYFFFLFFRELFLFLFASFSFSSFLSSFPNTCIRYPCRPGTVLPISYAEWKREIK